MVHQSPATRFITSTVVEVCIREPVRKTFAYLVPTSLEGRLQIGSEVLVPFGRRRVTGYVIGPSELPPGVRVLEILSLVRSDPPVDQSMIRLTRWVSDYYLAPWGEVLGTVLPGGTSPVEKETVVLLASPDQSTLDTDQADVLSLVRTKGECTVTNLIRRLGARRARAALRKLEAMGVVEIRRDLTAPRVKRLYRPFVHLTEEEPTLEELESLGRRAPQQASFLRVLMERGDEVPLTDVLGPFRNPARLARALEARGWVEVVTREVYRQPFMGEPTQPHTPVVLTTAQERSLRVIRKSLDERRFQTILLHGVTGSGKTEVYLRAIAACLETGRGAIALVPEISLTPQTVDRFHSALGQVAVLHSGLSLGERYDAWRRIRKGEYRVAIGVRSAVFAPVTNLGLVVVDEEHETSYKQSDRSPRYSARDVAVVRARSEEAVCILGSATPSLESLHNAEVGRYLHLQLPQRIDDLPFPTIQVVDMRQEKDPMLSGPLVQELDDRLSKGEQAILFLNRRGFSHYLQCSDCGHVPGCIRCSVSLTYHRAEGSLNCHYCGGSVPVPDVCPSCGSPRFGPRGVGIQKVERELARRFPGISMLRMDMDTTGRKGAHDRIYRSFARGEAQVLLGTQMVTKGFDLPHVTLVGVICADTSINIPDFRSGERTFQLLTQVAGRAGRGPLGGKVIIQTYSPDHYAIQAVSNQDSEGFFATEIAWRRELRYPPFVRLAKLVLDGRSSEEVESVAEDLSQRFEREASRCKELNITVLGPAPAPLHRLRGRYRWQIVLKSLVPRACQRLISAVLEGRFVQHGVRIAVDIDPIDMM
jgi:primosomal protein N' (replication factor Y)